MATAQMAVVELAKVELPADLEPWTFDDLLALPKSVWRCEIVDGALLMTPPAGIWHDAVTLRLRDLIKDSASPDVVLGPVGVDIDPTFLIPDLMVLPRETVRRGGSRAQASEVLLVVEVVSPGSVSIDRVLKPVKYAEAGIPHFWRVEVRPELSLTAYALPAGAESYTEIGTWTAGQTAPIRAPFEVDVEISVLAPDR